MAAIYGEGIEERTATFRTDLPAPAEMAGAIDSPATRLALVAEDDGRVGAFALVVPYAATVAYRGVGEYMIYVARRARRRGMGRELLETTCRQAREHGHWKLVGKLFADNEPSIALALACGFREVGVHHRHGQLEGQWRDVLVVERLLD